MGIEPALWVLQPGETKVLRRKGGLKKKVFIDSREREMERETETQMKETQIGSAASRMLPMGDQAHLVTSWCTR